MQLIRLNTIKNLINEFPLKASIFLHLNKASTSTTEIQDVGALLSFNLGLKSTIERKDYSYIDLNQLLLKIRSSDNFCFLYNPKGEYYKHSSPFIMSIEDYIRMNNKSFYKGLITKDQLKVLDHLLPNSSLSSNNIFTADGSLTFELNKDYLYVFIRLIPASELDLSGLIMFLNTDSVCMISERNNKEICSSLGFIIKLNDRYRLKDYDYKDKWSQVNINPHIKYTINKKFINEKLFDNVVFKYKVDYSLLYITNNKLLDKHGLKIIDI